MSNTRSVIIVTGANRGIGAGICSLITSREYTPLPKSFVLYATSRKGENLGYPSSPPDSEVRYPKLDISDKSNVDAFVKTVKSEEGGVDVLINNAGINTDDEYSAENAEKTLRTNFQGTLNMCRSFLPLLRPQGRIVNVSSTASSLSNYSPEIQHAFKSTTSTTLLSDLDSILQKYISSTKSSTESQAGFPQQSYAVSKAATNAMTKILAKDNPQVTINCCCPGWVATDMGKMIGGQPPKSEEEGARVPLKLGFKDLGGVSGEYWGNDSVMGKGEGVVQPW